MANTDQLDEVQEQFSISLSSPTNEAVLGSEINATFFIKDGNSKFSLQ